MVLHNTIVYIIFFLKMSRIPEDPHMFLQILEMHVSALAITKKRVGHRLTIDWSLW